MTDKTISISVEQELFDLLNKRAKKSLMNTPELIEDIIRRSMISYKRNSKEPEKTDDKLMTIFSRRKKEKNNRKISKKENNSENYYSTPLDK